MACYKPHYAIFVVYLNKSLLFVNPIRVLPLVIAFWEPSSDNVYMHNLIELWLKFDFAVWSDFCPCPSSHATEKSRTTDGNVSSSLTLGGRYAPFEWDNKLPFTVDLFGHITTGAWYNTGVMSLPRLYKTNWITDWQYGGRAIYPPHFSSGQARYCSQKSPQPKKHFPHGPQYKKKHWKKICLHNNWVCAMCG